jgi:hypothetical protein
MITMKLYLKLILVWMTMLVISSCSDDEKDDYKTPENLVGTTWKCETVTQLDEDMEYIKLKFTSATVVEEWTKYKGQDFLREWVGTYAISGNTIIIQGGEVGNTITGTINGVTMSLTVVSEVAPFAFTLQ